MSTWPQTQRIRPLIKIKARPNVRYVRYFFPDNVRTVYAYVILPYVDLISRALPGFRYHIPEGDVRPVLVQNLRIRPGAQPRFQSWGSNSLV